MKPAPQPDRNAATDFARQGRLVAIVIAVATVAWLLLGEIGRQHGWAGRYAFLIDLAAVAAYVWALAVTWRLWRKRREN
ncbi:DUF5337 domain-containing protein [Ruixingdingia sedimenti]|uniref:DUF5337 domain-containing protein n=1 Tax=Ruixingdingia sedimenti TaxID=3073604 RepID=A0ABU1F360_9RHOB|nr:DUF5337 domain-containing protein [Xinfangfangia sp. LG-4]MDR5651300.1 DUF5337 domain-containing protein [Xinfangfangia sp. LG-4]